MVSDIWAISRWALPEICSCKFLAFFRVYVTSEEFGQPDRKTTKQVWQVGLVAVFVTTSCSAVSEECPNTYRRQQTEQGTSCSNHWMETIRLSKDLFMLHIHPAWKIPTAHTTVTHLATQLVDPSGLGDQLKFICNYCGFQRLWKQDNWDKTIVAPHSVSNWCSSFVLCSFIHFIHCSQVSLHLQKTCLSSHCLEFVMVPVPGASKKDESRISTILSHISYAK